MKQKIYFINEDYDWMSDLLIEEDRMGAVLVQGIHISVDRPIRYKSRTLPVSCAKSFYDLDGLIVNPAIADVFQRVDPKGLHIVPVEIQFTDNVSLPYYRLDSQIEHNLIDFEFSVIEDGDEEDGYSFEKLIFSEKIIGSLPQEELHFFRLKGLELIQYMISDTLKEKLDQISHHIIITDEATYKGI